jgi:S-DNA-T family DNA segregation ATPase FtsK/SpoIIIE
VSRATGRGAVPRAAKAAPKPPPAAPKRRATPAKAAPRKAARRWQVPWLAWRVSPALRRDLLAIVLVMVAALTVWGLFGAQDGLLSRWSALIRQGFGWAAWLVPVALVAYVADSFRTHAEEADVAIGPRARYLLGSAILLLAILGLLHLPAPDFASPAGGGMWWEAGRGGGLLGYVIALPLVAALRPIGAGIVLLGVAIVATVVAFDLDLRAIGHRLAHAGRWLGGTLAPREGSSDGDDDTPLFPASAVPELDPEAVAAAPAGARRAGKGAVPLDAPPDSASSPVINLPKVSPQAVPLTVETIERPAKPRPALDGPTVPLVVTGQLPLAPSPTSPVAVASAPVTASIAKKAAPPQYPLPAVADLPLYESVMPNQDELGRKARRIEETLAAFKIEARVREVNPGPAVTQFALEPGSGVKVRSIKVLENDLALALAASSITIETPIPGQSRVGIVIPNKTIAIVGLRETMESPEFLASKAKLPVALGRDVNGHYIVADLAEMPHLLIAGSTGAGKSVCLNSIISTFLLTRTPDELKLVMVDPKMVELVGYNNVPHLKSPVVIEMDKVVGTLRKALSEMERRYTLFSNLSVRNIKGYNARRETEPSLENLPYLVIIIDELADLMMTAPDEVESVIVRLAQMARATGIHLIIATQRPSVDVLTGLIKANFPARIAFMVTSQIDSRVILDSPGAERLLGKGDMLFQDPQAAKPVRVQGTFVHDRDIEKMVNHWRTAVPLAQYEPDWMNVPSYRPGDEEEDEDDPMMAKALKIVEEHGTISTSMLQRKLRIGYNKAARLVEQMEEEGIIGPSEGVRGRTVLGSRAKNPADPFDDDAPPPWDEE